MSRLSLLFAALLLAVLAAAQSEWQSDMLISTWSNVSATKICAADAPSSCYFVPKPDFAVDPTKTLMIVTYQCGTGVCNVANPIGDYLLLRYIFTATKTWYVIDIPRGGLLYSPNPFKIGPAGSNMQVTATSYTVCGKTYSYAYYVSSAGSYNITPLQPPYYIVDVNKCIEYRIAALSSGVVNITTGWFSLYLAELMPYTWKIFYANQGYALNGTLHAYFTYFHAFLNPRGSGFYIMGPRVSMTLVMRFYYGGSSFYSFRGPVAFDTWSNYRLYSGAPSDVLIAYNIGLPPGDGFMMATLLGAVAQGGARLAYVSENTTGYFMIQYPSASIGAAYATFHRRYAVADVTLADGVYLYNTRGIACPIAYYGVIWGFNRLDRIYEIEICNNRTDAVYAAFFTYISTNLVPSILSPGFYTYLYGDLIMPGRCARLKWDSGISSRPELRIYTSPQNLCSASGYIISTTSYNPNWRYFLFANNTLKAVAPIAPDYDFPSLLKQLLDLLGWQYNNVLGNYSKWYATQRDAAQKNATQTANLTSFFASQFRFLGNIRMESATSTWLKTTLSELQKWQVVAPAVGGAVSVSLQAPSALTASAAAAAVATAWAASRRSLATAAFLAGFAILATALFAAALYGATVTAALVMAAVILMSIGAAAAWQKQTGEE